MKNIILIGMMGSGKTTVGRLLSRRLGRALVDTDAEIVARQGRSIPDIFAADGEEGFRAMEGELAAELAARQDLVVACGGGLPTRRESIAPLKERGVVFWLERDPALIYDSLETDGRPLAQDGRQAFLDRAGQRAPIYRRWADYVISGAVSPERAAGAIATILQSEEETQ